MASHELLMEKTHIVALGQKPKMLVGHSHGANLPQNLELDVSLVDAEDKIVRMPSHDDPDDEAQHENGIVSEQKAANDVLEMDLSAESNDPDVSEHKEFTVSENEELHENVDAALVQSREPGIEPVDGTDEQNGEIMISTPVLQARTHAISPDFELHFGQEFADVQSCRRALRDTAIALHFEIQTIKSDKTRFTAKCASD
ncbi:OLC1v1001013C1 [Oldenlandia corymbosa var. corymbosa]|uniref:OLC1v1001013C1 n=1 Tax=Oldenlandia corymbosa var. corymbosa TaxID=529605 RepID=A0AAV1D4C1_OLDCO|nr:OLC1v1001013C1 [Oldenlandia corymbosa var. corymbosa]